jgi:hypothetical protein
MAMGTKAIVVAAGMFLLGSSAGGCGAGGGGDGSGSACFSATIPSCPATVKAGQPLDLAGSMLGGAGAQVVFKDATGRVVVVRASSGDDASIRVTVPADYSGRVTVSVCGASCSVIVN